MPLRSLARRLLRRAGPAGKHAAELAFWRAQLAASGGTLGNGHYQAFFTTHFGLTPEDYAGKRVLDVGCGPRGSLEWATMAAERWGADPLADAYRELGIGRHAMRYVTAGAERLPFDAASFDVVATLNSLDHVDDVDAAIAELTRVAAPGATLLLLTEVGHPPTPTEPQELDWSILERFAGWRVEWSARNGVRPDHDVYRSVMDELPWVRGPGLLRARCRRVGPTRR